MSKPHASQEEDTQEPDRCEPPDADAQALDAISPKVRPEFVQWLICEMGRIRWPQDIISAYRAGLGDWEADPDK